MQCSGIILKITTDLQLVLIFLCQIRPFVTRRLVQEDNGRLVRRIYGTGTIVCQNSALDQWELYDVKHKIPVVPYFNILNRLNPQQYHSRTLF